jgi:hypothetical protein
MRTILLAVIATLVVVTSSHAQAASARIAAYFSSDRERIVTLSQGGVVVASVTIPVGTLMMVTYTGEPNLNAKRFEAHGGVSVRVLRDSELHGRLQADAMLAAPVTLAGDNIDLVIQDR